MQLSAKSFAHLVHLSRSGAVRRRLILAALLVLACAGLGANTSLALSLSSTVLEDNGATSNGLDGNQSVYDVPTANPGVLTTAGGYDFTATQYMTLTSITSITVTLTMQDGNSDAGDFDFGHLRLALNGTDTGLVLNGFRGDGLQDTFTFTGMPTNAATILTALKTNGKLAGTVTTNSPNDTVAQPNEIYFGNDAGNATTTLSITGAAIPEPGTWAALGLGALVLTGSLYRRGWRQSARA